MPMCWPGVTAARSWRRRWSATMAIAAGCITWRSILTARHKGYGGAIMAAAEDWLRRRGIEKLQLMVRPGNEQVQAFYASLGYDEQARVVYAKWLDGRQPTP